jgi:hypothetical protein
MIFDRNKINYSLILTGDRFFTYRQGLIKNNISSLELDELITHNLFLYNRC